MDPEIENTKPEIKSQPARRSAHQRMLEDHKETKAARRERHRKGWHKFKPVAILFI
jgi:hypothetical protein